MANYAAMYEYGYGPTRNHVGVIACINLTRFSVQTHGLYTAYNWIKATATTKERYFYPRSMPGRKGTLLLGCLSLYEYWQMRHGRF